jgi:hypothetical protein
MIIYKRVYLKALGYDASDFIPSELSGQRAVDIHHIIGRGKKGKDQIENLMALTREEHIKYGDKVQYMVMLLEKHMAFLESYGVSYNKKWFKEQIDAYRNKASQR